MAFPIFFYKNSTDNKTMNKNTSMKRFSQNIENTGWLR